MNLTTGHYIIGVLLFILVLQIIIRLIRRYYKFPIPAFMVALIDNPLRRIIQPPTEMPHRHGIKPGMTVLEVGPGNGTYSVGTARQIGLSGNLITVDIQSNVIKKVKNRADVEDLTKLEGIIADVHHLPFRHGIFDAIYMIAVIGEIPKPVKAIHEFYRVLSPSGTLAFSELVFDPDYPLARTLTKWAEPAGFQVRQKQGHFMMYTLMFEKTET